jgi:hypothetical protein
MLKFSPALGLLLMLAPLRATATPGDSWLPGSGNFAAAVATGVPFLVMSELSVGVTEHAALGVLGGTTPIVSGFGVRPRGAVPLSERWRLLLSAPIVFYPERTNGPAWWLARPSTQLEWRPAAAWSLAAGAGIVGIATQGALFGADDDVNTSSPYGRQLARRRTDLWWTLNALASLTLSEQTQVFADATGVFRGYLPAGSDWIGGPPLILFLGVSTRL